MLGQVMVLIDVDMTDPFILRKLQINHPLETGTSALPFG